MPYVSDVLREVVDAKIDEVADDILTHTQPADRKGLTNYLITRLALRVLKPASGWNYSSLADVVTTLECSKSEVYRRLVAPYEDGAIQRNGDVPELSDQLSTA